MPIQAICSSCGRRYNLADNLTGKTVKCKDCGESFVVSGSGDAKSNPEAPSSGEKEAVKDKEAVKTTPAAPPPLRSSRKLEDDNESPRRRAAEEEEDDRPRRTRRDEDDEDVRPRRRPRDDEDDDEDDYRRSRRSRRASGGGAALALLLGGIAAAVLVAGGALFFVLSSGTDDPAPAGNLAQADPQPVFKNNPAINNPPDNPPNNNPPDNQPPRFDPPKLDPPPIDPLPKIDPPPKKKLPRKEKEKQPPPPLAKWIAQPDPGPDMTQAPANPKGFLPLLGNPHVVFPSTPSPFIAARHGTGGKEGWQIMDVRKFQQVGALNGRPDIDDEALSPDGKYLAGKGKFQVGKLIVNVVGLKEARIVQTIDMEAKNQSLQLVDFLEKDHLLTYTTFALKGHFKVWNIATGQEVKQIDIKDVRDRRACIALSPGRKYLAVAHEDKVQVFQPLTSEVVGEVPMPKREGFSVSQVKGLAFSADGAELACFVESLNQTSRLVSWKMTGGEVAVDHQFVKRVSDLVGNTFGYKGNNLEWVPDGSGWLLFGQAWIDYQSGAPVYKIPADPKDFRRWPRRLIGKDHVVLGGGDFRSQQIGIMPLPKAEIAAAVKAARAEAGGAPAAAALPPPQPADVASAKALPQPIGNVPWKVQPDAAPVPKGKLTTQPIAIQAKPADIVQILFSRGDVAQTVILSAFAPNPLSARKQVRTERYDLHTGKLLDTANLFSADMPDNKPVFGGAAQVPSTNLTADLSPDGARLVLRYRDGKRLDLWDLAGGKHLAGWQPYEGRVEWLAFVDSDHVLTLGDKGKLYLWKVPQCQAVYGVDGYLGRAELSPTRKYLALQAGATIELMEALSGERCGQLEAPAGSPNFSLLGVAFSRDGRELVAGLHLRGDKLGGPASRLSRWKLETGAADAGFATTLPMAPGFMRILPSRQVLVGDTLHDWNLKGPLWSYPLGIGQGVHAQGSPDGRHWFAQTAGAGGTILVSQALPDQQAQALANLVVAGQVQPVAAPGMSVQVVVSSGLDRFRNEVLSGAQAALQSQGYKIGPGGLTVQISAAEGLTGQQLDYEIRKVGIGGIPTGIKQMVKITERKITLQASIADAQGIAVHKTAATVSTPSSLRFDGDDYERQLNEAMWNNAAAWGRSSHLPTNLYRVQGQIQQLPRIAQLKAGG